jgi:hypothetical protein
MTLRGDTGPHPEAQFPPAPDAPGGAAGLSEAERSAIYVALRRDGFDRLIADELFAAVERILAARRAADPGAGETVTEALAKARALRPSTDAALTSEPEMRDRLAYRRGINDAVETIAASLRQSVDPEQCR